MLCSIAGDPSGAVYKIISVTWDGSDKECYLHKHYTGGESRPEDDKDVLERNLIPPAFPRQAPCELTPPPSEREWSPPCSDSGSDQGVPVRGCGSGPIIHSSGDRDAQSAFPSPRSAYMEDGDDSDDEDYESRPPLSPAMAQKGLFPADEEYYARPGQSYLSDSGESNYENEYHGRDNGAYGQEEQGFVSLGPQGDQGFVSLGQSQNQGFIALGQHDGHDRRHEAPLIKSDRSDRRSHGKKQKRPHREKSEKEKEGDRSKSKPKNRSRRSSTSSKKDDRKEEKRENSHRSGRHTRKPSIWALPKF